MNISFYDEREQNRRGGESIRLLPMRPGFDSKSYVVIASLGRLPFVKKNRKFRLEIQMVQLILPEIFRKKKEIFKRIPLFPFQPEWPENRFSFL